MRRFKRKLAVGLLVLLTASAPVSVARATCPTGLQSCSTNYGVGESFFGNGGNIGCSSNYCAAVTAGELSVGSTASTTYQAHAGFNTIRYAFLEFNVNTVSVPLGVLSTSSAATGTATFSVKSYLSSGYNVQTQGSSPTYGGHSLAPITTAAASNPGTEQFGMNVVRNLTSCATPAPINFGADPAQVPDSTFSFGQAAPGYNTCGKFQYNSGDVVALSNESSGETDYTISYIANISSVTPAGEYRMNQVLVATATF